CWFRRRSWRRSASAPTGARSRRWHRTRTPARRSGPPGRRGSPETGPLARSRGRGDTGQALLAAPHGLALVEEGFHAFPEIAAHVAHQDQVLLFLQTHLLAGAADPLLGRSQGERRMPGNLDRQLPRPRLQGGGVRQDLAEQADAARLL